MHDVNRDGLPDLVTAWEEGHTVRVYLNPGSDKVTEQWPRVEVGRVPSGEDAIFVDLDRDGSVDVISCTEGSDKTIYVHWAPSDPADYLDGAKWKTEPIPASVGRMQWMFCEPMDVDGRHGIDLVVGGKGKAAAVGWWESPSNPRDLSAWTFHPISDAGWIMSIIIEDMDGDGTADILMTDRQGNPKTRGARWLKNPGPGAPTQKQPWTNHFLDSANKPFSDNLMFAAVADVDGDGLRDVVAAALRKGILYMRRLSADGLQWQSSWIDTAGDAVRNTGRGVKAVAVGDVTKDGKLDLVCDVEYYEKPPAPGVFLLQSGESPLDRVWAHTALDDEAGKFDRILLLDLDGDGDLDIVTTEERRGRGVIWFENPHVSPR